MDLERIAPNRDAMTHGDKYLVTTDDQHQLTLEVRRNGPYTAGYFISFVSSQPPITETIFFEGEIFVKDDEVVIGQDFKLSCLSPLLSHTAFRALEISSLPELLEVDSASVSQQ